MQQFPGLYLTAGFSHWNRNYNYKKKGLSDNLEPVNILAVGYSDEEAADPERHSQTRIPVEELVYYETI